MPITISLSAGELVRYVDFTTAQLSGDDANEAELEHLRNYCAPQRRITKYLPEQLIQSDALRGLDDVGA